MMKSEREDLKQRILNVLSEHLKEFPAIKLGQKKMTISWVKFTQLPLVKKIEIPHKLSHIKKIDMYLASIRSFTKEWENSVNRIDYVNEELNMCICIPYQNNPEGKGVKVLWLIIEDMV